MTEELKPEVDAKEPRAELMKGGMAFKLKDSDIFIWISEADIKELKSSILLSGIVGREIKAVFVKDTNVSKAQGLHQILSSEKGMPPELRIQYYEEILRLYKTEGEKEEDEFLDEIKKSSKSK